MPKALLTLLCLATIPGCANLRTGATDLDGACAVLPRVTFSKDDTLDTARQVERYRIILDRLCP